MASTDRFEKLYAFLREHEISGEPFELEELAEVTGYARSSVRTHLSKKLKGYVVFEIGDGMLVADGVGQAFTRSEFLEYLSQTSRHVRKSADERVADRLRDRALDALRLGVEAWHRRTTRHPVAALCRNVVEAWEQLLKAEVVEQRGREAIGGDELFGPAARFSRLVEGAFPVEHPVRLNLTMLRRLHEEADELLMPDLEPVVVELLQAAVLNWRDRWEADGGDRLDEPSAGMLVLGGGQGTLNRDVIEKRYGEAVAMKAERFIEEFRQERRRLDSPSFAVSGDRVVVLASRARMGDVVVDGEAEHE